MTKKTYIITGIRCRHCGRVFPALKLLGAHAQAEHPGLPPDAELQMREEPN
jgi:hypothetical protein